MKGKVRMINILLYLEVIEGNVIKGELELCTFAKELTEKSKLVAIIKTDNIGFDYTTLFNYGIDECYIVDGNLKDKQIDICDVIITLNKRYNFSFIMGISSVSNKEVLSLCSGKLQGTILNDCIGMNIYNNQKVIIHKVIFGGKIKVSLTKNISDIPIVLTIRNNLGEAKKIKNSSEGKIFYLDKDKYNYTKVKVLSSEVQKMERPELNDAKIVVSVGRGCKNKQGFDMVCKLADLLNAAVGASRTIVDEGITTENNQVGQTGKVISPFLYIAVGISGAPQHIAGMRDSKHIIAINNDCNAEIFEYANYGVVGDLFDIVPRLCDQIIKKREEMK